MVAEADIPTLHRAVTTANEVRNYLNGRAVHMGVDNIEPMAMLEFLSQSQARVRAAVAIGWMRNKLQLSWPLLASWLRSAKPYSEEAQKPDVEGKRVTCVQPFMIKVLGSALEAGAEMNDPTWMASLASWFRAMAGVPFDVIQRSIPVEHFGDWMIFYCTKGRNKHSRQSYWGVPADTANGYNWATKFLREYSLRRENQADSELIGMIFRTDTREYLCSNTVRALTGQAMVGIHKDVNPPSPRGWKSMMPALAFHLYLRKNGSS